MERVKIVNFHVAADMDVPIQSFFENTIPQLVHGDESVSKFTIAGLCDQLNHDFLQATLVMRH